MDMTRDNCRADVRSPCASEAVNHFHVLRTKVCVAYKHGCFLGEFDKEFRESVRECHFVYLRFIMAKLLTIFRHTLRTLEPDHSELVTKNFFSRHRIVVARNIGMPKLFPCWIIPII